MTNGSSQGLFVIVSVVIFGIFVGISYLLFQDKMTTGLSQIFCDGFSQSNDLSKLGKGFCGIDNEDEVKELPVFENSCDVDYTKEVAIPNKYKNLNTKVLPSGDEWGHYDKIKIREENLAKGEEEVWAILQEYDQSRTFNKLPKLTTKEIANKSNFNIDVIYHRLFHDIMRETLTNNNESIDRLDFLLNRQNLGQPLTIDEQKEFDVFYANNQHYIDILKFVRKDNKGSIINRNYIATLPSKIGYVTIDLDVFDNRAVKEYDKERLELEKELSYYDTLGYEKKETEDTIIYENIIYRLFDFKDKEGNFAEKGTLIIPEKINNRDVRVEADMWRFDKVYLLNNDNYLEIRNLLPQKGWGETSNLKSVYMPNVDLFLRYGSDNDQDISDFLEQHCITDIDVQYGVS